MEGWYIKSMKKNKDVYVSDFPTVDSFYEYTRANGIHIDQYLGIIYQYAGKNEFGNLKFRPIGMAGDFSDPHYMFQFMLDAIKRNDRNMTKRIWRKPYLSRHLRYGKQQ